MLHVHLQTTPPREASCVDQVFHPHQMHPLYVDGRIVDPGACILYANQCYDVHVHTDDGYTGDVRVGVVNVAARDASGREQPIRWIGTARLNGGFAIVPNVAIGRTGVQEGPIDFVIAPASGPAVRATYVLGSPAGFGTHEYPCGGAPLHVTRSAYGRMTAQEPDAGDVVRGASDALPAILVATGVVAAGYAALALIWR